MSGVKECRQDDGIRPVRTGEAISLCISATDTGSMQAKDELTSRGLHLIIFFFLSFSYFFTETYSVSVSESFSSF